MFDYICVIVLSMADLNNLTAVETREGNLSFLRAQSRETSLRSHCECPLIRRQNSLMYGQPLLGVLRAGRQLPGRESKMVVINQLVGCSCLEYDWRLRPWNSWPPRRYRQPRSPEVFIGINEAPNGAFHCFLTILTNRLQPRSETLSKTPSNQPISSGISNLSIQLAINIRVLSNTIIPRKTQMEKEMGSSRFPSCNSSNHSYHSGTTF